MKAAHRPCPQVECTPCRLLVSQWPICYANGCYHNYHCPVYRGGYPSPVRDYLPLPPVFVLFGNYEAVPYSYGIPVELSEAG